MEKRISPGQFEELMAFTRRHFVEHYDLQAELADHLANGIEQQWAQNPGIDFNTALQAEFKKFGIFGFSDVVEQRTKVLYKKYYRLMWGYFIGFFRLPVALATVSAVLAMRFLLQLSEWIFPLVVSLLIVISGIRLYRIRKSYNNKVKESGRKWLLEDIIFGCGGFGVIFNVPAQLYIHLDGEAGNGLLWFLAVMIVLLCLYDYVVLWVLPSRAEEHLQKTYPEYKLVAG